MLACENARYFNVPAGSSSGSDARSETRDDGTASHGSQAGCGSQTGCGFQTGCDDSGATRTRGWGSET
jgi:hypothetical protein